MANHDEQFMQEHYRTGNTKPPRQYGGLVAFLLVLVLLLGSLCSALGIVNLHLLQQLASLEPAADTVHLFREETGTDSEAAPEMGEPIAALGLWGESVSDFDHRFYNLPYGVLVTDVLDETCAHRAGLRSGDVIVALDGMCIADRQSLEAFLETLEPGHQIRVEYYRQQTGTNYTTSISFCTEEE